MASELEASEDIVRAALARSWFVGEAVDDFNGGILVQVGDVTKGPYPFASNIGTVVAGDFVLCLDIGATYVVVCVIRSTGASVS